MKWLWPVTASCPGLATCWKRAPSLPASPAARRGDRPETKLLKTVRRRPTGCEKRTQPWSWAARSHSTPAREAWSRLETCLLWSQSPKRCAGGTACASRLPCPFAQRIRLRLFHPPCRLAQGLGTLMAAAHAASAPRSRATRAAPARTQGPPRRQAAKRAELARAGCPPGT